MIIFLLTLFVISIVLLIPTILLQTTGADNGIMSSNITAGAFGARSNEILVKFTSYCIAVFILSALLLSIHFIRLTDQSYTEGSAQVEEAVNVETTEEDLPLPISQ